MEQQSEQQRIVDLELQQARYDASLAERRYAACDPDSRLIAAQLEKSWEATLARVQDCEPRLPAPLQQLGRIPWVYPGAAAGAGVGAASAASQQCGCSQ